MKDGMNQKDGFNFGLQCGHPHKKPGETCDICGQVVPGQTEENSDEVRKSIQEDKGS